MKWPKWFAGFFINRNNSIQPVLLKLIWLTITLVLLLYTAFGIYFKRSAGYPIFTVTAVIGAYFLMGSVMGFIFAIPKSFQGKETVTTTDGTTPRNEVVERFRDNTSLEEISDWITKIIIGLSLTQFHEIQRMVRDAAMNVSAALREVDCRNGFCNTSFLPFSYSVIILFGTLGSMCGYLWTRIEFPKILMRRDKDIDQIKKEEFQRSAVNNPGSPMYHSFGLTSTPLAPDTDNVKQWMEKIIGSVNPGPVPDDPQKGRWGGKSSANGRSVTAAVTPSQVPGFYNVRITVTSTNGMPLHQAGVVLHPSFNPILRVLDPGADQKAYTELLAYEAFTLGVLCDVTPDGGYTALELDLNDLPGLPKGFYWKR